MMIVDIQHRPIHCGGVTTEAGRAASRTVKAPRTGRDGVSARGKTMGRQLLYRLWRLAPSRLQRLTVRVAAPKVSLGACAVIRDAEGRVLVAHHTYRRRAWGLPGGFIDHAEQPAAALARELREELDAPATVGPLLYAEADPTGRHLTLYYQAHIDAAPRPDGVEIDLYRYVAPDEAARLLGPTARPWLSASAGRTAA